MRKNHDKVFNTSASIFPRPTEALAVPATEAFVRKFKKEFRDLRAPNYLAINTQLKFPSLNLSLFSFNFETQREYLNKRVMRDGAETEKEKIAGNGRQLFSPPWSSAFRKTLLLSDTVVTPPQNFSSFNGGSHALIIRQVS